MGGESSLEGPQIEAARTRRAGTQWRTREAGCGPPLRTWNGAPPRPVWGKRNNAAARQGGDNPAAGGGKRSAQGAQRPEAIGIGAVSEGALATGDMSG